MYAKTKYNYKLIGLGLAFLVIISIVAGIFISKITNPNGIHFGKKYSAYMIDSNETVSYEMYRNGSVKIYVDDEFRSETPKNSIAYEDGKIIEVWTNEVNAYIIEDGDAIDVRGTIFRVEK